LLDDPEGGCIVARRLSFVLFAVAMVTAGAARANLMNPGFEGGDFTGWMPR
jgi:hypothetical protein